MTKEKPKSVFIATPMYGGMCSGVYAKGLVRTMRFLLEKGIGVEYRDLYNESMVTRARDIMTALFLKSECDYLLFIDADQSFKAEDVLRMIEEDRDILGGIIPKKQINWDSVAAALEHGVPVNQVSKYSGTFNVHLLEGSEPPTDLNKSFEVSHIGTGMMLIKREVFEQLKPIVAEYQSDNVGVEGLTPEDTMYEFWNSRIFDGKWVGEDVGFCYLWRSQGGKVYAAPWVKATHVGMYEFSGNLNGD